MTKIQFGDDGNINWGKEKKKQEPYESMLRALQELPFPVGKRLLFDVLQGNERNKSVRKNKLHLLMSFATLAYTDTELYAALDLLEDKGLIEYERPQGKPWKVLVLTSKGENALNSGIILKEKKKVEQEAIPQTTISKEEELLFEQFDFFLH